MIDKIKCDECGDEFEGDTTETLCDSCAWDADSDDDFDEEEDDE